MLVHRKCLIALRKRCDGGKRILYLCKRGFKNFTLREGVFVAVGKNEKLFSEAIFNFFIRLHQRVFYLPFIIHLINAFQVHLLYIHLGLIEDYCAM